MKARWCILLTVLLCCSACGAPSLRHKKAVNKLLAEGNFAAAAQKLEAAKTKEYSKRDALLFYLDSAAVLHDGGDSAPSDERLAMAQDRIDELFTQSVSAHAAQYLVNDLTVPYQPAAYERALTYYYRAMNFLSRGDIGGALVEANRAVYYLDGQRSGKTPAKQDNPFVQYFMSLVFESAGRRDDARIARTRALESYTAWNGEGGLPVSPSFPQPVEGWGEVVLVHANGAVPLKKSQTFQVAWGQVSAWLQDGTEGDAEISPQARNAIVAGVLGNAVTLSYPVLEKQPYEIAASEAVTSAGETYPTLLMGSVELDAETDLNDKRAGTLLRAAVRAATKRVAAVQAKNITSQSSNNQTMGDLAEMFVSFLGAVTEKADTRQWFTLPAQLRLARFYVPPGEQDIVLRFRNGFGKIVGEYTFEKVPVPAGGRVYLHYRTAK